METKRIVEINGTKIEVDLREAKVIENFKVGDAVKILVKGYGDTYDSYPGLIIGFDMFKALPSIVVAYLDSKYSSASIKYKTLNTQSGDCEICALAYIDEIYCDKAAVESAMLREIAELENKAEQKKLELDRFREMFGRIFEKAAEERAVQ